MGIHQGAGVVEKRRAVRSQSDRARRAFDQPLADRGLQSLQLHADSGLRSAERLRGPGETLQFGHQQERLHRGNVEGGHLFITNVYHCYRNR